jgi:O-acetyl-ADP-ribose deacetylase (regulator of RNase III)
MNIRVKDTEILLKKGDLTEEKSDAIVNAANNHLWMGGGVAGAIKRKGGQDIEDEAVSKGPISVGEAVVTGAGVLKARYVIHAAGMGTDLRTDSHKIQKATESSLLRAKELGIKSIAFPSIGTGVGGFPADIAADIMLEAAVEHARGKTCLSRIIFVLFEDKAYRSFEQALSKFIEQ